MAETQTQQLAALRESVAEAQHEAAIIKVRLGTIEQSAQADGQILRSEYIAEVAKLRAEMEKRFAAVEKGLGELRGEMNQGLGELRGEMNQGLAELRLELEKRVADLRAEMDQPFAALEKRLTDLRAEMKQGFADLRADMERRDKQTQQMMNAHIKWTVGAVAGATAVILAALRYMGPAAG